MEQAAVGRRLVGEAGPGVEWGEEGEQLAAAPVPALGSLLALVAALMLSTFVAVGVAAAASAAVAPGAVAAVESAAVAFFLVSEAGLLAGLVPRPRSRRALSSLYYR